MHNDNIIIKSGVKMTKQYTNKDVMCGFKYDKIFGKDEWYIEELDFGKAEIGVSTDLYFPRYYGIKSEEHAKDLCDLLNRKHREIEQLEKENKQLKKHPFTQLKTYIYGIHGGSND